MIPLAFSTISQSYRRRSFFLSQSLYSSKMAKSTYSKVEEQMRSDAASRLERMRSDYVNDFVVFADYDATITRRYLSKPPGDSLCYTAFRTVECYTEFPKAYAELAKSLHTHYFAIETDGSLSIEEKLPYMIEWYQKVMDSMVKFGAEINFDVNQMVREALDLPSDASNSGDNNSLGPHAKGKVGPNSKIEIRPGMIELINLCYSRGIPFVIVSAGFANIIEEVLTLHGVGREKYELWSNVMDIAEDATNGKQLLKGLKNELLHMYNKTLKTGVTPKKILDICKTKKAAVTIGDSLGDSKIAVSEEVHFDEIIKVGLLNYKIEENLEKYRAAFDLLYIGDKDAYDIVNVIERISSK